METKEWYFFKWAYPCMYVLVQMKELTREELGNFDKMYAKGESPSREVLEDTNKAAFRRLNVLAKEMKKDVWDWEVLRHYWEEEYHNRFIDRRDGNYANFDEHFCEMCKVHSGIVKNVEHKHDGVVLTIEMDGEEKKFAQGKFLEAQISDTVLTHLAYAIQKI